MQEKNKRTATIDLGTNTCLLLISELVNKKIVTIKDIQEIPRLGKGVDKEKVISEEMFEKIREIFLKYKRICAENDCTNIFAFGTSALRDAANKEKFINYINSETGIEIDVIDGKKEAKLGFEGALLDSQSKTNQAVLDIGGGSTEVSLMNNGRFTSLSMNIGAVRLKEKFFSESYSNENLDKAEQFVLNSFISLAYLSFENYNLVGVAGTVTTLSALNQELTKFDAEKINNSVLRLTDVERLFCQLMETPERQIQDIAEFMTGRHDIIVSGAFILLHFMKHFKFEKITVSTKGLRYGAALEIYQSLL
jgi:exopolyphosphatase/guanosine-5'-triphosphate,3'-diphosphate pyrophosphatase